MLSKQGTARRLMEAQQELILAEWMNNIELQVLKAISKGENLCTIKKIPKWVANNINLQHPDWTVTHEPEKTTISW